MICVVYQTEVHGSASVIGLRGVRMKRIPIIIAVSLLCLVMTACSSTAAQSSSGQAADGAASTSSTSSSTGSSDQDAVNIDDIQTVGLGDYIGKRVEVTGKVTSATDGSFALDGSSVEFTCYLDPEGGVEFVNIDDVMEVEGTLTGIDEGVVILNDVKIVDPNVEDAAN